MVFNSLKSIDTITIIYAFFTILFITFFYFMFIENDTAPSVSSENDNSVQLKVFYIIYNILKIKNKIHRNSLNDINYNKLY